MPCTPISIFTNEARPVYKLQFPVMWTTWYMNYKFCKYIITLKYTHTHAHKRTYLNNLANSFPIYISHLEITTFQSTLKFHAIDKKTTYNFISCQKPKEYLHMDYLKRRNLFFLFFFITFSHSDQHI